MLDASAQRPAAHHYAIDFEHIRRSRDNHRSNEAVVTKTVADPYDVAFRTILTAERFQFAFRATNGREVEFIGAVRKLGYTGQIGTGHRRNLPLELQTRQKFVKAQGRSTQPLPLGICG